MFELDLGKLDTGLTGDAQYDPRNIFTTLSKHKRFNRPSDEQSDVLTAWFENRDQKDTTIKINTGGGKTLVGLLILKSSLEEKNGPAVYLVPDNYLLEQVLSEARDLGIEVTDDPRSVEYSSGRSILVANVWKLFNGKSVFGVGDEGSKIRIGSLIIDDAHACLDTVSKQFLIRLDSDHKVYKDILSLFEGDLRSQSHSHFLDIRDNDPSSMMRIPHWAWRNKHDSVLALLHANREDEEMLFNWPLVKRNLKDCKAVFSRGVLEISPNFIPIDMIPSFVSAQRRIYMTATLADDSILVTHFSADAKSVSKPIFPKNGGVIGDRMILVPEYFNTEIYDSDIKEFIKRKSKEYNCCVIVPSNERAKFWNDSADQILKAENLVEGVSKLKAGHVGLTVLINKYDGVDLPGPACDILVLDGLPEVQGVIERYEGLMLDDSPTYFARQVQRIEQGMGRGIRSGDDHCLVFLMGSKLVERISQSTATDYLSPATRAHLKLSEQINKQMTGRSLKEIEPALDNCLKAVPGWVARVKASVIAGGAPRTGVVNNNAVRLRAAHDFSVAGHFREACKLAEEVANASMDKAYSGYIKQQLSDYMHELDPISAQEIQKSAQNTNKRLLRPIAGVEYKKISALDLNQSQASVRFMHRFLEANDLVVWSNALLDDLEWSEPKSKRFEKAIMELGAYLGFRSQMPETESGRGPDNLWAVGGLKYYIIECKSGATEAANICKKDCNQLNGSIEWFDQEYDQTCHCTPIIIHPKRTIEHAATLTKGTRIIDEQGLEKMKVAIKEYTVAICQNQDYRDHSKVHLKLKHFKLTPDAFVQSYSVDAP
ncbi:DEAD/DEAH box helicase [Paracoccus rhizosphaerae]|uniref:DEAD/DEAH box helicase n=1 Tax=Paracoccus rhizosphaerae TaxID=1133347 RepID=A0ABV6CL45_9RHOB|nr:DEAD/DEAH box helicase [Paracoccus rhizosphaerae]